jgi:hypothetical protein
MPQDTRNKFRTRSDFGIYDQRLVPMKSEMGRRPDGSYRYRAGDTRTVAGDRYRLDENGQNKMTGDISDLGLSVRRPSNYASPEGAALAIDNEVVAFRDAKNARVAREKLAGRAGKYQGDVAASASASASRAKAGRRLASLGALTAGAVAAGQKGVRDVPNETDNTYGMSALGGNNGAYPNQGKMSKALGVKNTKAGM